MNTDNGYRPDPAAEARDADLSDTPVGRVAAALGHPVTIFTEGVAVEPRLGETVELLRLWLQVREPEAARRILAYVAAVVAEQS